MSLLPDFKKFVRSNKKNPDGFYHVQARKIYILPTRFGLMFATMVLAMLVGSINYANNLGFMLTFFFAGLGILTMHYTWLNLLNLRIQVTPCNSVFAGQNASLQLIIENNNNHARGMIEAALDNRVYATLDSINAESSQSFFIEFPCDNRGLFKIKRLVISSQYPLGLFRAWTYIDSNIDCLVYAKPSPQWHPDKVPVYTLNTEGNKGVGSDDFIAHRNYRVSDSPRQIDWKIFAREKGLMTKQFGGDRNEQLMLNLDLLKDAPLETAISKLTRAVLDAETDKIAYGLELPTGRLDLNQGEKHQRDCLKMLALYGLEG